MIKFLNADGTKADEYLVVRGSDPLELINKAMFQYVTHLHSALSNIYGADNVLVNMTIAPKEMFQVLSFDVAIGSLNYGYVFDDGVAYRCLNEVLTMPKYVESASKAKYRIKILMGDYLSSISDILVKGLMKQLDKEELSIILKKSLVGSIYTFLNFPIIEDSATISTMAKNEFIKNMVMGNYYE